jgi:histone-lysine N-methyltransferase SETMAR
MYEDLSRKYPTLVNRKPVLLPHPHTDRKTKEALRELNAIELLPRPAYSPDLAPSDFHLLRAMAHSLRGRGFKTIEDFEMG